MKSKQLEIGEASTNSSISIRGVSKWISILDFIIRVFAFIGTLGSAIAMGTTGETLSISTQLVLFRAQYNDLPSFTFFVISNSVVGAYLVLSLPVSIFQIIKSEATKSRIILVIFDTVMMALLTSGASAATAIVYLSHKGNNSANWNPFCQQFNSFCYRITTSLIGSFAGIILFILLIIFPSVIAISRRQI